METEQIKQALQSKKYKRGMAAVGGAVILLVVFGAGMEIGYIKAGSSYKYGETYYRTFGPGGAHPIGFVPGDVGVSHGVNGTIVSVSRTSLVIADSDGTEKTVLLSDDTVVRRLRDTINASDLKIGDTLVVIGSPDGDADIDARLIRVIPSPVPVSTTPTTQPKQ